MKVDVTNPELEAFIRKEIEASRYASADEVVAIALMHFIATDQPAEDNDEIDEELAAEINEALRQAERGEVVSVEEEARMLGVTLPQNEGRTGAASGLPRSPDENCSPTTRWHSQLHRNDVASGSRRRGAEDRRGLLRSRDTSAPI